MRTIFKTTSLAVSLFLVCTAGFSQQVAKSIPNATSPDGHIGFLEFRPNDYGSQKHPLIIFLHGIGERGNGTTQVHSVAANGVPKLCAAGASMRFTVGGLTSTFVVLSPQLSASYGYWPPFYVKEMVKYAKANLQIDTNRIYITGLSLGGGGTWRVITDTWGFDHTFDAGIAAAAPVCGTQEENDADFASTIGTNHLPIWAFHSMDDPRVSVGATQHAEILGNILNINSPAMKFTYYQTGGHAGAWIKAYDTGHITVPVVVNGVVSNFTANPNLYEWLLSHTRARGPVANAGPSQVISFTTIVMNAAGSYSPNGALTGYSWQQVSGPGTATILNANSARPTITNMIAGGTYSFRLTVTDNTGATGSTLAGVTVTNVLLPVQFTYFSAHAALTGNMLQWAISAEQNNSYFLVERSSDGNHFNSIGSVDGAGSSKTESSYTFTDAKAPHGNVYYRLKQFDKNGKSTLSQVVLVTDNNRTATVQMYPNPLQSNLNILVDNEVKGHGKIAVYDATGHNISQQDILKNDKVLNTVVNMNNLVPGLYIIEVKIGDIYSYTRRVLKK